MEPLQNNLRADAETTALSRVARTLDCYDRCVALVDVATWLTGSNGSGSDGSKSGSGAPGWIVMFINEQLEALLAPRRRADVAGRSLQALLEFEDDEGATAEELEAEMAAEEERYGLECCEEEEEEEVEAEEGDEEPAAEVGPDGVTLAIGGADAAASGASRPLFPPVQPQLTLRPMPAAQRRRRAAARERRRLAAAAYAALDSAGAYGAAADPAARWGKVAAALVRGEVVEVGRVRLLCQDGRPSTTLVQMQIRCVHPSLHVLHHWMQHGLACLEMLEGRRRWLRVLVDVRRVLPT